LRTRIATIDDDVEREQEEMETKLKELQNKYLDAEKRAEALKVERTSMETELEKTRAEKENLSKQSTKSQEMLADLKKQQEVEKRRRGEKTGTK
jgi:chromosome segregation ATPase